MLAIKEIKVKPINLISKTDKIPKLIIYYFLTSQLCFGVDFGFGAISKKRYRYILMFLSNVTSAVYIAIILAPVTEMSNEVIFWSIVFEYMIYVIALKIISYKILNLMIELNEIFEMRAEEKRNMCVLALAYTLFLIIVKLVFQMTKCFYNKSDLTKCARFHWILNIFYGFPYCSLDMIAVSQVIIVYCIYCNMKKLAESLNAEQDLQSFVMRYVSIIDCYDKIKPVYNTFVSSCQLTIFSTCFV